jgi:hypothetical protein
MTTIIGRRVNVGVAKESSRGQTTAAVYWLPKTAFSIDDKINTVVDESSVAAIEDADTQEIANTYAEGSIEGLVNETTIGIFALAVFGTETSHSAHTGETVVYDHVFNVAETAQHQSLCLSVVGDNELGGQQYALAMVDQFDLNMEVGKYITYKATFLSNVSADFASTASFATTEKYFKPQDAVIKFAVNQAGLTAASKITAKKVTLSVKKNIEEDWTIGSTAANDRNNKQFAIEGTMEIVYTDRTYIDTIMLGDLAKAIRISAVSGVTIGSATNPAIQIDLYSAKLSEVARKMDLNGIITQTLKFKAFYSKADAKMATMTVVNTISAGY